MTILIVGASGATGKLLVDELLEYGESIKIIVRDSAILSEKVIKHEHVEIIRNNVLNISEDELKAHVKGCRAIVSCLGHNLTFKGIYGDPHRLVTRSIERLCIAAKQLTLLEPIKVILMNSTGNKNQLANEKTSILHSLAVGLIRHLIPPHADNEQAADYLQSQIGMNNQSIQWVVVRPDSLTNETIASPYSVHPSPIRSAIFDAGKTSRINVANFMKELLKNSNEWDKWQGKMPVIYNQ